MSSLLLEKRDAEFAVNELNKLVKEQHNEFTASLAPAGEGGQGLYKVKIAYADGRPDQEFNGYHQGSLGQPIFIDIPN